jgi:hypothetical protein
MSPLLAVKTPRGCLADIERGIDSLSRSMRSSTSFLVSRRRLIPATTWRARLVLHLRGAFGRLP